jgi:hypothetical protein
MILLNNRMWNIVPGKSVGPFELGHEPDEYFDVLTGAFRIVKRFPDSEDIYAFGKDRVHLTVDSNKKIHQISIFRPNEVYLGDIQLLNRSIQELAFALNSTNDVFEPVDVGLESDELGIVLVEVDGFIDGVEVRKIDS